jgi:hypothetical protein
LIGGTSGLGFIWLKRKHADMPSSEKIAESVIEQMASQVQLFTSLSLAICGALLLLIMQVVLHNHDQVQSKQPIGIRSFYLWVLSFVFEGGSICFGALSQSAITSVTPAIFRLDFAQIENWTSAEFEGSYSLRASALLQFAFFFLGILTVLFFVLSNRELIGGSSRVKKA